MSQLFDYLLIDVIQIRIEGFSQHRYREKRQNSGNTGTHEQGIFAYHANYVVLDRNAIAALAGPSAPELAPHSNHSYGYDSRSSAALNHTRATRASAILEEICGLAAKQEP